MSVLVGIPVGVAVAWVAVVISSRAEENSIMTAKLSTMQANHELFSSVNADVSDIHECFWMLSKEVSLLLVAAESVKDALH